MTRLAKIYLIAVLVFLYLPILVMMAMAFNRSALYEMPFTFDLVWFKALMENERLLQASWNSVWIASVNAVIATSLGTLAATFVRRQSCYSRGARCDPCFARSSGSVGMFNPPKAGQSYRRIASV